MTVADHRRRKRTATPISEIPMSINASESVTTEVDFSAAKTPTKTPTIENNHRITRSPPMQAGWVAGPLPVLMMKFHANIAPLKIYRNICGIGPLSRGGSDKTVRGTRHFTYTTFKHVPCGNRPSDLGGTGGRYLGPPQGSICDCGWINCQDESPDTFLSYRNCSSGFPRQRNNPPRQIKISSGVAERI